MIIYCLPEVPHCDKYKINQNIMGSEHRCGEENTRWEMFNWIYDNKVFSFELKNTYFYPMEYNRQLWGVCPIYYMNLFVGVPNSFY